MVRPVRPPWCRRSCACASGHSRTYSNTCSLPPTRPPARCPPTTAPPCCSAADVRPPAKKSLGQNFLIDGHHQRRIVAALAPTAEDVVVEIGPEHGALTQHLLGRVRRLLLVELDDAMAARWQGELHGRSDAEVRHQDALTLDLTELGEPVERIKVVGNIPYNITSPLIFHLLARGRRAAVI